MSSGLILLRFDPYLRRSFKKRHFAHRPRKKGIAHFRADAGGIQQIGVMGGFEQMRAAQ